MTQLLEVRRGLDALAARRRRARAVDVLLVGAAALAALLLAYYQLDRRLTLSVASRLFLNVVLVVAVGWFVWRKLLPAMANRDDAIATALRFERRRGIDADLVAALEFEPALESDRGAFYGSPAMASAVVDDVARSSRDWDLGDEPVDAAPTRLRILLAAFVALGVISAVVWPRYTATFAERMLLSSPHYPSMTRIHDVTVAWRPLYYDFLFDSSAEPGASARTSAKVPLGRPLKFEMLVSGEVPDHATLEFRGSAGVTTELVLSPDPKRSNLFRGVMPSLVEDLQGRAVAGDAYTEEFALRAVPLPTATVTLEVRPPAYAVDAALDVPPPGRLYAAVLEGSDVAIHVAAGNKPLTKVVLSIGEESFALESNDGGAAWRLAPQGTPLAAIRRPIEFAIEAVDGDGFELPDALRGALALRPDQPPSVTADVVTKFVLPEGKPTIHYQAADDLGVETLVIEREVQRLDGRTSNDTVPVPLPPGKSRTAVVGTFPLDLTPLQLHKGERVTIRLSARDRRGADPRAVAESEPFVLEVTDEQGLYEAMAETDQRSALKMDEIIQKQLMMTGQAIGRPTPTVPKPNSPSSIAPAVIPPTPAPTAAPSSTQP